MMRIRRKVFFVLAGMVSYTVNVCAILGEIEATKRTHYL